MNEYSTEVILKKREENNEELRRCILCKNDINSKTVNYNQKILTYKGNLNCKNKFNYCKESTICPNCTEISSLHNNEITNTFKTHYGEYGSQLLKYEMIENFRTVFSNYINDSDFTIENKDKIFPNYNSFNLFMDRFYKAKLFFNENEDLLSHQILISILAKYYFLHQSNIISANKCNNEVRLLKFEPENDQLLSSLKFSDKEFKDCCISLLYNISESCFFNGTFELKEIFHGKMEFVLNKDKVTIKYNPFISKLTNNSFILCSGYSKNKMLYLSRKPTNKNNLEKIKMSLKVLEKTDKPMNGFILIDSLLNKVSPMIKITNNLFNFTENFVVPPFESFNCYIMLISLLCNRNFFNKITTKYSNMLKIFFIESEIDKILNVCSKKHNKENLRDSEIKETAIECDFHMYFSVRNALFKYINENL